MSLLTYTSCNVNVHMVALRKLAMPVAGGVPCVGSTFLILILGRNFYIPKTFFTYEQQLNKRQHEKGFIIPNPASNKRNYSNINRLVKSMKKAIALPSRYTYISYHATTYGNVPIHYSRTTT